MGAISKVRLVSYPSGKLGKEIDQLETTKLDADVYNRWREHFVSFLLLGAVLVLLAVSLSMSASRRVA